MLVFIDESGTFVTPDELKPSISRVAALVVPESQYDDISKAFELLVASWNLDGQEPKGRNLDESQVADTIAILKRYDVILKVAAIDIGLHLPSEIQEHRALQCEKVTENVTEAHNLRLVEELNALRQRLSGLTLQLFLQAVMMIGVVESVIRSTLLHYALTRPEALGAFRWVIDAKDDKRRTTYEDLWLTIVSPALQSRSLQSPFIQLEGCDYSYFERFCNEDRPEPPAHLRSAARHREGLFRSSDARKIMEEDLQFSDSRNSVGLQLVDILANAFRRACNGRLLRAGWQDLGRLVIRDVESRHGIRLHLLGKGARKRSQKKKHYWDVLAEIDRKARKIGEQTE